MTHTVEPARKIGGAEKYVSRLLSKYGARVCILAVCAAVVWLLHITGVGCPLHHFSGVYCPGCGLTRAVLALCRLDLKAAFALHPMVFTLPLLFLYFWLDGKVFRNRILNISVLAAIAAGFALTWMVRI